MQVVPEPLLREPAPIGERAIPIDHPQAALGVLRTYQRHAPNGLQDLARVARAHWLMARQRGAIVDDIVESRSWRLTKPLRWVKKQGQRLTRARKGSAA
jgi:hypothetical protein